MSITPHDHGTFLIESQSREGEHICDVEERTCSCEAFNLGCYKGQVCEHLAAALREHYRPALVLTVEANPLLLI